MAITVLRLRKAAEESETGDSTITVESGCMSTELTEDGGIPNALLRQLPAPEPIAISDVAAKLAAAAISNIQELLDQVDQIRISHDELRRTLDDLKRDRDEWRGRAERAERLIERPWWRRLAG